MVDIDTPLADLIPHRPPMRLIDAVVAATERALLARVSITPHSPFVHDSRVRSAIGLEYIAQAAAAFFTLRFANEQVAAKQVPVRAGMLIACPRLVAYVPFFAVGTNLLVRVAPASRIPAPDSTPGLVKFTGTIRRDGADEADLLVSADVSVYI